MRLPLKGAAMAQGHGAAGLCRLRSAVLMLNNAMDTPTVTRLLPADHPQRGPMTTELHARPFLSLVAPAQGFQLAFLLPGDESEGFTPIMEHLNALIDHVGGPPASVDARYYTCEVGPLRLKWERHTEFVSYTILKAGPVEQPFAMAPTALVPDAWLSAAPGPLISAMRLHLDRMDSDEHAARVFVDEVQHYFQVDSLAAAFVGERQALAVGDFRMDEDGFIRFALLVAPGTGPRRLGRLTQRLMEIETYRSLAMLALPVARAMGTRLTEIEAQQTALIAGIAGPGSDDRETLANLTQVSAAIEALAAESAFRLSAARAYTALVQQRLAELLETRAKNRQTFSEFMARRFTPSMRTCEATQKRLDDLADRAARAASLLSVRVTVTLEAQNQALLESMNRRSETQLRLQRAVEGLSVVAISYYAVSLASYVAKPVAALWGISGPLLIAGLTVPVVGGVWYVVRRLRVKLEA